MLLVDDEPDIRRIAEVSLSMIGGWSVICACSGEEAIAAARAAPPDAILLDVMMPGLDGPETFSRLLADPLTARIPVIFMTAKAQSNEVGRYLALGARGVIRKPFDPMTLPRELSQLLGSLK
jgi:two-component system OmpR family response regulator